MLGIRYIKTPPTTYLLHYRNGKVVREGVGLSFFYYAPESTLVAVPLGSADVPFAFQEETADFQGLTVQGQLTYRVNDPKRLAGLLDYSLAPGGGYCSEDPEALTERLVHATQVLTRSVTRRLVLREALVGAERIEAEVLAGLRKTEAVTSLGVEVLGLGILSMRPTPEMAKALEAEAREALQRHADGAIYARRNAAVEQERRIKESELNTELAIQEKRRQIREAQMAADVANEERRTILVERKTGNERLEADARAYALEAQLKPVRGLDWRTLLALSGMDSGSLIALAFRDLAENAQKIGELNISPELLHALTKKKRS